MSPSRTSLKMLIFMMVGEGGRRGRTPPRKLPPRPLCPGNEGGGGGGDGRGGATGRGAEGGVGGSAGGASGRAAGEGGSGSGGGGALAVPAAKIKAAATWEAAKIPSTAEHSIHGKRKMQ